MNGEGGMRDAGLEEALAALLDAEDTDVLLLDDGDDEIAELAELAAVLRSAPVATPDPAFKSRLRAQLIDEAAALAPTPAPVTPLTARVRERVDRWRRSASVMIASALSASAIGGAGVAVAAERAQPDDVLYGVKQVTESLRLRLADDRVEAGRLHLAFAERRLSEVELGARTLAPDTLIETLARMDEHAQLGANALLDAYDSTGDQAALRELAGFVDDQTRRLSLVIPDLPVEVVPFANHSLEVFRRIEVESGNLVLTGCTPCVDGPFDVNAPGDGPASTRLRCCPDADTAVVPGEPTTDGPAGTDDTTAGTAPDGSTITDSSGTDGGSTTLPVNPDLVPDDSASDLPTEPLPSEVTSPIDGATEQLDDTVDTVEDTASETIDTTDDLTGTTDEVIDTADDLLVD